MIGKCKAIAHGSNALEDIFGRASSVVGLPSIIFAAESRRISTKK